jgi:hypothetical protein
MTSAPMTKTIKIKKSDNYASAEDCKNRNLDGFEVNLEGSMYLTLIISR